MGSMNWPPLNAWPIEQGTDAQNLAIGAGSPKKVNNTRRPHRVKGQLPKADDFHKHGGRKGATAWHTASCGLEVMTCVYKSAATLACKPDEFCIAIAISQLQVY